jgi:hypothetical protein
MVDPRMKTIICIGSIEGFDTVLASLLFADFVLDKAVLTYIHIRRNESRYAGR